MRSGTLDLSKYATPALVRSIQSVVEFLGESIKNLVVPPVCAIALTLFLSYLLPFETQFAYLLFLGIGIIGGSISAFFYGLSQFISTALQDVKKVITETALLLRNVVDDIARCVKDPSAIPPLSDLVLGVVNSVALPVVHQVLGPKAYGGVVLWVLDPVMRKFGTYCASIMKSLERRFARTNLDRQERHEPVFDSQGNFYRHSTKNEEAITKKKHKIDDLLRSLIEQGSNGIDRIANAVDAPLRIITCLMMGGTVLSMLAVYELF